MEITLQNLNQQEKEQLWAQQIQECRSSSLSVDDWCSQHDIKPGTYYYWQKKIFKKVSSEAKFTEISTVDRQESTKEAHPYHVIATVTINEMKVEIYAGSDQMDIENLIRGLKSC